MIVGGPNQSIEIRQATRAAIAPPRHRNGSDPEPFQRFLEQIHTHIDDPTEVHRSMARVPVAFLFVAPVPPRNDRNCLAQRPFCPPLFERCRTAQGSGLLGKRFQVGLQVEDLLLPLEAAFMLRHAFSFMSNLHVGGLPPWPQLSGPDSPAPSAIARSEYSSSTSVRSTLICQQGAFLHDRCTLTHLNQDLANRPSCSERDFLMMRRESDHLVFASCSVRAPRSWHGHPGHLLPQPARAPTLLCPHTARARNSGFLASR